MADQPTDKSEVAAPVASAQGAPATEVKPGEPELSANDGAEPAAEAPKDEANVSEEPKIETVEKPAAEDAIAKPDEKEEGEEKKKPAADVEMKDATDAAAGTADPPAAADVAPTETPTAKGKGRRKSAAAESKGKALSKKASKARLTHTDAKPGDHFLVKLKGFPAWPAIICDESMLPEKIINSRPVTAARADGTYTDAYADGGKKVNDRSFPVMYLQTNEFGWVSNTALTELTPDKALSAITEKMRKDLKSAFELASEHNSIDHYKQMLQDILADLIAQEKARQEAAATPRKSKKGKGKAGDDDEDVDMADAEEGPKSAKSKKRKAEDDTSTPQRSDSVKKPKIKLNTSSTPKTANGATPKSKDEGAAKSKSKSKKAKEGDKADTPKEVKMTPEERHARKEKEVLYLRHKLQRGLLTRDQQPQEAEMKQMSEFVTMLENFADLEVSIIRTTKINKVLKAILKLDTIPREEEFQFKKRSQGLLDNWNKLMASDGAPSAVNGVNGVNGTSDAHSAKKPEPNGIKESVEDGKADAPAAQDTADAKETTTSADEKSEKVASEAPAATSEVVEASA